MKAFVQIKAREQMICHLSEIAVIWVRDKRRVFSLCRNIPQFKKKSEVRARGYTKAINLIAPHPGRRRRMSRTGCGKKHPKQVIILT